MTHFIFIITLLPVFLFFSPKVDGNTLNKIIYHTAITAKPESIDPKDVRNVFSVQIASPVLEGLVKLNEDLDIVPAIAKKWEIRNDGKEIVFYLRQGIKFHNGKEVHAKDVVYSLSRLIREDDEHLFFHSFDNIVGVKSFKEKKEKQIKGIISVDEYTVLIKFNNPNPTFYQILATPNCAILPENFAENKNNKIEHYPISTGPFKVDSWLDDKIILSRYEEYHGKQPQIQKLIFHVMKDEEIISAFENNQIHDTFALSMYHDVPIKSSSHYIVETKIPLLYFLAINTRQFPFNNISFRRALQYGLDRKRLLKEVFPGETPAYSNIPYGIGGYSIEKGKYRYNPEKAKKLLVETKLPKKILVKKTIIWARVSMPNKEKFKKIIEENLSDIGLNIEVRFLTSKEFFDRFYARNLGIFYAGHNVNLNDARYVLSWYESTTQQNFTGMNNSQFDFLISLAREEKDDYIRSRIFSKADEILSDEAVQIVLYNKILRTHVKTNVKNFMVSALGPTVKYEQMELIP